MRERIYYVVFKTCSIIISTIAAGFFIYLGGKICYDNFISFQEWISLIYILGGGLLILFGLGFVMAAIVLIMIKYDE